MDKRWERVPILLAQLYEIVDELELLFGAEKRKFTPDGHLVGSIGEACAAFMYDLELLPPSFEAHDARTKDGRLVQVKFTAGKSGYSIYGKPDNLIALRLVERRNLVEIFNGPGAIAWECVGGEQKNGQRALSMSRLAEANCRVPEANRIRRVHELHL